MRTLFITFIMVAGIVGSAEAGAPPGWPRGGKHEAQSVVPPAMTPAKNIEKMPTSSLSMRVGEKRSFKPVQACGCTPNKILRCQVEKGILTVYAKSSGRGMLMPMGKQTNTSGPPQLIHATVTE